MGINRFDQQEAPARFSPLSFQELAYAPITLRNREDAIMDKRDEILDQMNNLEVFDSFQGEVDAEKEALRNELSSLATKIQKEGAGNINYVNDFRNLKNKYNQAVSKSGNIGRAVGVNENVKAMRDAYFTDAYKKGHQAQDIERNWQIELNKFRNNLPNKLSEHKGQIPEMIPGFAPSNLELADKAAEYGKLMTGIRESINGDFKIEPYKNPNTGEISFSVINTETGRVHNNAQIQALTNLLQRDITNPHSDLNQNLKYKGIDPQDYLSSVEDFATLMHKVRSVDKDTIQFPGFGGSARKTTTTKPEKEIPTGSLVKRSSGQKSLGDLKNPQDIDERIKIIEDSDELTKDEKDIQLHQLNVAKVIMEKVQSDEKFAKPINEFIYNNKNLRKAGITNYDNYLEYISEDNIANLKAKEAINPLIADLEEMKYTWEDYNPNNPFHVQRRKFTGFYKQNGKLHNDEFAIENSISPDGKITMSTALENKLKDSYLNLPPEDIENVYSMIGKEMDRRINGIRNEVETESNVLMNPLLEDSYVYSFNIGDADTEIRKSLEQNLKNIPLARALNDQSLQIKGEDGWYKNATTEDDGEGAEFLTAINDIPVNNLTFDPIGFFDGGNTESPTLMFNVFNNDKNNNKKFEMAIELKKGDELTRKLLSHDEEYYKSLDASGKAVLDAISDKIYYGGIATDITKGEEMFDREGTENIKSNANHQLSTSLGDSGLLKSRQSPIYDYLFVNPRSNVDYSILINKDEPDDNISFSMYSNTFGEPREMTFEDYIMKEAAINYANNDQIPTSLKPKNEIYKDPYWAPTLRAQKAKLMHDLVSGFKNLDDFNAPENSLALMYSHEPQFLEALKEANQLIISHKDRSNTNTELYNGLENIFNKKIATLGIRSKSRKLLL